MASEDFIKRLNHTCLYMFGDIFRFLFINGL